MSCHVYYPLLATVTYDQMAAAFDDYFDWSALENRLQYRWKFFIDYERSSK